ncbi:GNAT family N-acetyltransferase [Plantactinospora siamensis]|uniref:GNAT family N-acetyltransferase n=1 Tax=Plantactinospora siamensis TaxID=555372 RepID=A0ABV6P167_9ACTN
MINGATTLTGRAAILAATGQHPYPRHALVRDCEPLGRTAAGATAWLLPTTGGPAGGAYGPTGPAVDLLAGLLAERPPAPGSLLHLPRVGPADLAGRLAVDARDDWDFRWLTAAPAPVPGAERVVRLTAADTPALTALIDGSFPTSTARPDDPRIVAWYGIRDGARLVACGADRSRGDIGFLAGLTVATAARGRGLGAALTVGMARSLFDRFDTVALGVYTHNTGATRLYRRLGFTAALPRTSVRLA